MSDSIFVKPFANKADTLWGAWVALAPSVLTLLGIAAVLGGHADGGLALMTGSVAMLHSNARGILAQRGYLINA